MRVAVFLSRCTRSKPGFFIDELIAALGDFELTGISRIEFGLPYDPVRTVFGSLRGLTVEVFFLLNGSAAEASD
jgi:hypothetical protein